MPSLRISRSSLDSNADKPDSLGPINAAVAAPAIERRSVVAGLLAGHRAHAATALTAAAGEI
jgi:hypothetical protein